MSIKRLFLAFSLLFAPAALLAQAGGVDWSKRVTLSAVGGHVLGNPVAGTRLVEYVSYTCIHCAAFTNQAGGALKLTYVRKGGMSVEVRNLVRDPADMTAAMLARCGGKDRFFGNHAALFANYDAWMNQLTGYVDLPVGATPVQRMTDIADKTGLFALMRGRGFTQAQLNACIADKPMLDTILKMTEDSSKVYHITGTPSFLLNGKLLDKVHDWNSLKDALPAQARS
jgi:protein-disulfide isomerase